MIDSKLHKDLSKYKIITRATLAVLVIIFFAFIIPTMGLAAQKDKIAHFSSLFRYSFLTIRIAFKNSKKLSLLKFANYIFHICLKSS